MSDQFAAKIIVLRPNLPFRSAQPRTKKDINQQRIIRELSKRRRKLRIMENEMARSDPRSRRSGYPRCW